jgi:hypothetical protein
MLCRVEIIRWIMESLHPFSIVKDRGFKCLMKTGHPEHYIPSAATVSRDVRLIFARTHNWIAEMLQVREATEKPHGYANWLTRNTRAD